MIGTTISHYRVLGKLGQGGMGEVFLARDSTLDREVALKFLPEALGADREVLARFEREARVLASLNHPNIAIVHGLEQAGGQRFIVMERVEGHTLADRLLHGALPLREALAVCRQIAAGLETAHERGIIHRDLKPANIMISDQGVVKILDFGLARVVAKEGTGSDLTQSVTITQAMTRPGTILGTAPYMSPEQATGNVIDKRSDIWAFGCVLYECLSGQRPFDGADLAEVIGAILGTDPDWSALPSGTPASLRTLLRRCLQKDRQQRLHDIGDARLELEDSETPSAEDAPIKRRIPPLLMMASAVFILLAGVTLGRTLKKQAPLPVPTVVSTIELEPGYCLDGIRNRGVEMLRPSRTAFAIAGDGSFLVYSAIHEGDSASVAQPQLYLRRLDESEAHAIPGTEGGINPFLSPNDRWVAFLCRGMLKKVPIQGGVATTVCELAPFYGAHWGSDGTIVFARGEADGISSVSADGGEEAILTRPDPALNEYSHRLPFQLPHAKGVIFTVMQNAGDTKPWLALWRPNTGDWQELLSDAADGRYLPSGHLVFLRRGALMAVRFDLTSLETIGQPIALVDDVVQAMAGRHSYYHTTAGQFAISRTGWLVYAAGGVVPKIQNELVWVDRSGREQAVTTTRMPYMEPRLSPDGQKIVFTDLSTIWIYDLRSEVLSALTQMASAGFPFWTSDGTRIIFSYQSRQSSKWGMYWKPYDGHSAMELLAESDFLIGGGSISPDGRTAAVLYRDDRDSGCDIGLLDLDSRVLTPFLNTPHDKYYPEFSPDGRWIAYASDESGELEVYVQPFPGGESKQQVSRQGGTSPLWSRDGRQLFFRSPSKFWVVDVQADGSFEGSKPRLLFENSGYTRSTPLRSWDISLDSQRFLMVKIEERKPTPITKLTLVQNWLAKLP